MKISFLGASRQVTGSMFLLELNNGYNLLVDCGIDMSRDHRDFVPYPPQWPSNGIFPFEPSQINGVVLTHAHIDHSGELPNLVREGFEGKIYCTQPTYALTQLLLMDSAGLYRKKLNAIHASGSKHNRGRGKRIFSTVNNEKFDRYYLESHVEETADHFQVVNFKQRFKIAPGVWVTLIPTGHLLGAANVLVEEEQADGRILRVGFSGDLGRQNYPLLPDPEAFPQVDYLITESTYGKRFHEEKGDPEDILAEIIREACINKPGRLIIPAFSVGRTQSLLYTLNRLYTERDFPPIRVFSDSPLALASTKVYEKFRSFLNAEAKEYWEEHGELFDFENLVYVEKMTQSLEIANYRKPCIIISASGMVSGGRVEHHIRTNISNPYCTILMVGYAVEGTLGHSLLNGQKEITIENKKFPVLATIQKTDIFSGHADLNGLKRFVGYQKPEELKKLFLVHGDYEAMLAFQQDLSGMGFAQVELPEKGSTYTLSL